MADTQRSLAELLALYADGQPDGAGTFQDHRDILKSLAPPYSGGTLITNGTVTTINTIDVFETIAGTFVETNSSSNMSFNVVGGVMTYNGVSPRHFHIVSNISLTSASNNQIVEFCWFKNGTTEIGAPIETRIGTGTDIGTMSLHADAMLSNGDTIELKITNRTSTSNFTVVDAYVFVMGMFM